MITVVSDRPPDESLVYLRAPKGATTQRLCEHDLASGAMVELLGADHMQVRVPRRAALSLSLSLNLSVSFTRSSSEWRSRFFFLSFSPIQSGERGTHHVEAALNAEPIVCVTLRPHPSPLPPLERAGLLARASCVAQEDTLSAEEKQRRERLRMVSTGVTSYSWGQGGAGGGGGDGNTAATPKGGGGGKAMLVPVGSELFVGRERRGTAAAAGGGARWSFSRAFDPASLPRGASVVDARMSADGARLTFVCDAEVVARRVRLECSPPRLCLPRVTPRYCAGPPA